ncbi:MAG: cation diffusion facilitator family transporter [Methanomassiliicoccales archaeon]
MISRDKSFRTISVTLIADCLLFAGLLGVAAFSGSKAVLSEALYQFSDLASGGLLIYAIWSSLRPPDNRHPFGYGLDRFFWSFVSAVFVFSVNGAISIFLGLAAPLKITLTDISAGLISLAITCLISIVSLLYIIRAGKGLEERKVSRFHQGIRTVLLQDVMSVVSSVVAAIALLLYTSDRTLDADASIINGVLLMLTGLILAYESRELLIGKGLKADELARVSTIVEGNGKIQRIREIKTMYMGPDSLLLVLRINFVDDLDTDQLEQEIDRLQQILSSEIPELKHVIIEPES